MKRAQRGADCVCHPAGGCRQEGERYLSGTGVSAQGFCNWKERYADVGVSDCVSYASGWILNSKGHHGRSQQPLDFSDGRHNRQRCVSERDSRMRAANTSESRSSSARSSSPSFGKRNATHPSVVAKLDAVRSNLPEQPSLSHRTSSAEIGH